MKLITISREFGSGGRELGKRLADLLGFDYYDKEIITSIARNKGLDENYVADVLENHGWQSIPLTLQSSFAAMAALQSSHTDLLMEQTEVMEQIAQTGKDCIIVGRNADVILRAFHPFKLFVCADMDARLRRCVERAPADENLTEKEMEKKIRRIDHGRAQTREILTDYRWGESRAYHLTINTTDWNIKELARAVAPFAEAWFEQRSHS